MKVIHLLFFFAFREKMQLNSWGVWWRGMKSSCEIDDAELFRYDRCWSEAASMATTAACDRSAQPRNPDLHPHSHPHFSVSHPPSLGPCPVSSPRHPLPFLLAFLSPFLHSFLLSFTFRSRSPDLVLVTNLIPILPLSKNKHSPPEGFGSFLYWQLH